MSVHRPLSPRSVHAGRLQEFPEFVFAEQDVFRHRGSWRSFFGNRIGPAFDGRIIFEIGCFDAAFLNAIALRFPTTAFVGLDWKCKPLVNGAERIVAEGIRNVALLRGRGQDIARIFAAGEVDEIWLFHPDPCDKPAELKNRLFAEPFLIDAHQALRDQGSLCLKTDHLEYYRSAFAIYETTQRGRFDVSVSSADLWNDAAAMTAIASRCFANETTLFERRFIKKRQPIYYFEILRK